MSWARIDDGLDEHPKVDSMLDSSEIEALAAVGLWVLTLANSSRRGTDGHVTPRTLTRIAPEHGPRLAEALEAAGLYDRADVGYDIHDFLDYNPSAKVARGKQERISEVRAEAGRKGAEEKWRREAIKQAERQAVASRLGVTAGEVVMSACEYCATAIKVDWSDEKRVRFLDEDGRATPELDHVQPVSQGGQNDPDNLVLACLPCNRSKCGNTPDEWPGNPSGNGAGNLPDGKPAPDPTRPDPSRPGPSPSPAHAHASPVAGAATGTGSLPVIAGEIASFLQRTVDGLTGEDYCRPVSPAAVLDVLVAYPASPEVVWAIAQDARGTAQSQNKAPNIVGLFKRKLAAVSIGAVA